MSIAANGSYSNNIDNCAKKLTFNITGMYKAIM